ncbi:hypothetical protein [Candidatus Frankia alpina]|nr:hypothetical protein [Candidatus Frankia alpina]
MAAPTGPQGTMPGPVRTRLTRLTRLTRHGLGRFLADWDAVLAQVAR